MQRQDNITIPSDSAKIEPLIQQIVSQSNQEFYGRVRIDPRSELVQQLHNALNEDPAQPRHVLDDTSYKPLADADFQETTLDLIKTLLSTTLCKELIARNQEHEYEGLDYSCKQQDTCDACQDVIQSTANVLQEIINKADSTQVEVVSAMKRSAFRLDHDLIVYLPEDVRTF